MENKSESSAQPVLLEIAKLQEAFFANLRAKGRSANTLKNYKTDLDCFNTYLFDQNKTTQFQSFSLPEVLEYGKYLEQKYQSDNSRRRRVQALRLFFDYLVENGHFNHNPVRKVPTSPKFLDIPRPASFSHVKTLWQHLLEEEKNAKSSFEKILIKRNQVIYLLIYTGGLKVSELSSLQKGSFTFGGTPKVIINHPKRDPYTVELHPIFNNVYESYIDLLEKLKSESQIEFSNIFFNANAHRIISGGISPRGIEILFKSWSKSLYFEVTPKALRQSCIFTWLQKGEGESTIKEWMGVSPSYSLKLYKTHINDHNFSDQFLVSTYQEIIKRTNQ